MDCTTKGSAADSTLRSDAAFTVFGGTFTVSGRLHTLISVRTCLSEAVKIANPFEDPEIAAAFTAWSSRDWNWLLGYPFLFRALDLGAEGEPGPVLDVGCGHGDVAAEVARRFATPVVAVDSSAAMLEIARRDHPHPAVTYHQAEGHRLNFVEAGSMRAAYCAFLLVGMPSREAMRDLVAEIARTLRPGARFVILDRDREIDLLPTQRPREGDLVTFPFGDGTGREITTHYWPISTYAEILAEAGFGDVRIERPTLEAAAELADPALLASRDWSTATGSRAYAILSGTRR
ncbi:class I SAM-dependent methyltransferase [Nonomuraea jabiensis]|nr:class I SAM-dependent methyltransferase [Nonomuraea jabiensis]